MTIFDFISLFGGLALFLYGMRLMGDGLKHGSSGAFKSAMGKVTNNPLVGFLVGLAVTAVIQSSTATIVITSGLVGAGVISLHQSLGLILGANVGTTVTGQIIRLLDLNSDGVPWLNLFKPSTLAPLAAMIGILLIMAFRFHNSDTLGSIAMGFGILFTGLMNMTAAVSPLSQSEAFTQAFVRLSNVPILGFLVGTGVAFLIQSSSATIGILQALSVTGALTFGSVYAIIIGVNIGDCVTTAIVCSIGSKADAKRTGMVHIIFNLFASVLIVVSVLILRSVGVLDGIWSAPITSGGIANAHTLFRLAAAVVLLPASGQFERLARRIIPDDKVVGENVERELGQLDEKFFHSPALALAGVHEAVCTMARLACSGVNSAMEMLDGYDPAVVQRINENEDRIDTLADAVSHYLIRLSPHMEADDDSDLLSYYIQCFSEFERIGDYAVNLTENALELQERELQFSPVAQEEIQLLRQALRDVMQRAENAFVNRDPETARHIEPLEEVVDDLVASLRGNHTRRLRDGQCTVYTGLTFLDVLTNVERISDQCSNVGVYTMGLGDSDLLRSQHDYIRRLHQGEDRQFNVEYKQAHGDYYEKLDEIEKER